MQTLTRRGAGRSLSVSSLFDSLILISCRVCPAWKMSRTGGFCRRLLSQPALPRGRTCNHNRRTVAQGTGTASTPHPESTGKAGVRTAAGAPRAESPTDTVHFTASHLTGLHSYAQEHPALQQPAAAYAASVSSCYVHPQLCTPVPSLPAAAAMAGGTAAPAEQLSQASTAHSVRVLSQHGCSAEAPGAAFRLRFHQPQFTNSLTQARFLHPA